MTVANRQVAVMRDPLAGVDPALRARRATQALESLGDRDRGGEITARETDYQGNTITIFTVGDRIVFALAPGDVQEAGASPARESEAVRARMRAAFEAIRLQRLPQVRARGAGIVLLATALALGLGWLVRRGAITLQGRITRRIEQRSEGGRRGWSAYALPVVARLVLLARWALYLALAYALLVVALEAFPLTAPLADRIERFFALRLGEFVRGIVEALPGLATLALILLLTRAVAEGVALFFDNVHRGRLHAPLVHPETAHATKRLVTILVWGVGIALAYPYIPGSSTEAFKGISVIFGLMLTLGSAGLVNQLMSGLVVVYSRALRRGDLVEIGDTHAVVLEVNALATKFANLNREEITVPNAVLISQPVRNFSRLAESGPVLLSVVVTIGYDAPWRQVQALLLQAAQDTEGIAAEPAAYVLQRALDDFYVRYELLAPLEASRDTITRRPHVLSELHANVQDAFNAAGVQIMSPHFEAQPEAPVLAADPGASRATDRQAGE